MKPLSERLSDRKLISHGDISSAFRARDTRLDRDVFLKILHPQFAQDSDLRTRFDREAKAAAKIDHPQLVRIYEVGEDPNEGPFMILEWVEGETLAAKIKRDKRLRSEQIVKLAASLLHALAALHKNGILHRDVKPDNILCRNDGEFKLTDFSLALLNDAPKLTHHNAVVGTPAYLAPELARGKSPSERSDLFAVGVVLYEAATGVNPFYADALLESLRRVREEQPDWKLLDSLVSNQTLVSLVRNCLEKEAVDRPESAGVAAAMLNGDSIDVPASNRSGHRPFYLISAAAVIIGIISAVFWPRPEKEIETPVTSLPLKHDTTSVALITADALVRDTIPKTATSPQKIKLSVPDEAKNPDSSKWVPHEKPPTAAQMPDSFDLFLDTTPWAHVSLSGKDLGTTPLGKSLKLPRGKSIFVLRNPAYPPILASIDVDANGRRLVDLNTYVQHVEIDVEPWGDVYLDNELIGTTPLNKLLAVLPGSHNLRVTHPKLASVEKTWLAVAGDTLSLRANLQTSELAVRTSGEKH